MGIHILQILEFFGDNKVILGIASISSILGTLISVYLIKSTSNIKTTLNNFSLTKEYNAKVKYFKEKFEGYKFTLVDDNIFDDKLRVDILSTVNDLKNYNLVFTKSENKLIDKLKLILEMPVTKISLQELTNSLVELESKLRQKEANY